MTTTPIEIHYWNVRGRVYSLITLLEYTNTAYTWKKTTDPDTYFSSKSALKNSGLLYPNLPYIVHNDIKISESWALMAYAINQNQNSEFQKLLPDYTKLADFYRYRGIYIDISKGTSRICYESENSESVKSDYEDWVTRNMKILKKLDDEFKSKKWTLGDQITIVDFYFAEVLEKIFDMENDFGLEIVNDLGYLKAFFNRFCDLEKVKAFREGDQFMARPYHWPALAKWF